MCVCVTDLCECLLSVVLEEDGVDVEVVSESEGWLVVSVWVVLLQRRELLYLQGRVRTRGRGHTL